MRHSLWRRFISQFKDISLEQTSSLHNPYLEVLLVKGRHQLVTKDAIYSFDDKYLNFREAFRQIDWDKTKVKRVLVLGLGLGSVILILEKIFEKSFDYTAIEVDPEICRLCSEYTLPYIDSFVEVIPVEAMQFLESHEDSYDMIIMDIFQSATVPYKFQSVQFLELLNSKLNPEGIILYNRMNITVKDRNENKTFESTAKIIFPNSVYLNINDNKVLINDKGLLKEG